MIYIFDFCLSLSCLLRILPASDFWAGTEQEYRDAKHIYTLAKYTLKLRTEPRILVHHLHFRLLSVSQLSPENLARLGLWNGINELHPSLEVLVGGDLVWK